MKDLNEAKYQYLIRKLEKIGLDLYKGPKALIKYLNNMHNVYKPIDGYSLGKIRKILVIFYDMIADIISNKNVIKY